MAGPTGLGRADGFSLRFSPAGANEALALPALKRVIRVETLLRSAQALLPPHECGGSHHEFRSFSSHTDSSKAEKELIWIESDLQPSPMGLRLERSRRYFSPDINGQVPWPIGPELWVSLNSCGWMSGLKSLRENSAVG